MNRTASLVMAFAMVVSMVAAAPAAAAGMADVSIQTDGEYATTSNETVDNESEVQLGERLSGIVAVQEAEIDGEVESRAFGLAVAKAETNESKADIVAQKLENNSERVAGLEQRLEELEQQRDNEEISEGEYRAKAAAVAVQLGTVERTTNQSAQAAGGLPAELLEERGIDAGAIEQLRQNASELRGGAADVAGDIAGDRAGAPAGAPEDRPGPDGTDAGEAPENVSDSTDRAAQETERAGERVDAVEQRIDEDDEEAQATLEEARDRLENADSALADARSLADEDAEEAIDRAADALEYAEEALELAEEADDERAEGSDAGDEEMGDNDGE